MKRLRNAADTLLLAEYTQLSKIVDMVRHSLFYDIPHRQFVWDEVKVRDRINALRAQLPDGINEGGAAMALEYQMQELDRLTSRTTELEALIDEYKRNATIAATERAELISAGINQENTIRNLRRENAELKGWLENKHEALNNQTSLYENAVAELDKVQTQYTQTKALLDNHIQHLRDRNDELEAANEVILKLRKELERAKPKKRRPTATIRASRV